MKTVAKAPAKKVAKPKNSDHVVESVESILALLRGVGPLLIGSTSALGQAAVTDLVAGLKDPVSKED